MPRLVVTMANSRFDNEILVTCFHLMQVLIYFYIIYIKLKNDLKHLPIRHFAMFFPADRS